MKQLPSVREVAPFRLWWRCAQKAKWRQMMIRRPAHHKEKGAGTKERPRLAKWNIFACPIKQKQKWKIVVSATTPSGKCFLFRGKKDILRNSKDTKCMPNMQEDYTLTLYSLPSLLAWFTELNGGVMMCPGEDLGDNDNHKDVSDDGPWSACPLYAWHAWAWELLNAWENDFESAISHIRLSIIPCEFRDG